MKKRASFTFSKETFLIIDELVKSSGYRNRSHAVEEAIKFLGDHKLKSSKRKKRKK